MIYYIGIDVSKDLLDVYIRPESVFLQFKNSSQDIQSLLAFLKKYSSCLVLLEATGGYEKNLQLKLTGAGIETRIINPKRVREFAKACGKLAKTDTIDAEILSLFAERMELRHSYQPSEEEIFLKDLVHRRRQLIEELVKEKNRLDKTLHALVRKDVETHLRELKKHVKKIDDAIVKLIASIEVLREKAKIIASMPGVGVATAAVLLADLPELGSLENKQIAALVGVAPMNKDSGKKQGYRKISGGRLSVRCSLYMATLVAIRHNSLIKTFYQRLRDKGKPAKVAITAAMRKMIVILNQILRHGQDWNQQSSIKN